MRQYDCFMHIDFKESIILLMEHPVMRYHLGELGYLLNKESETIIHHYRSALDSLTKGGFDLSMNKWVELVSLRTVEVQNPLPYISWRSQSQGRLVKV